ncbi:unnamed protein product [Boreogadus saida]
MTIYAVAVLQVSISLNKVEISVGESKFFICTFRDFVESTATSPPHLSLMLLHPRHLFHHPRHPFQEESAREQARHEESEAKLAEWWRRCHLAVAVLALTVLKSASVSVASLARPDQYGHLGEVCCYGTGRYDMVCPRDLQPPVKDQGVIQHWALSSLRSAPGCCGLQAAQRITTQEHRCCWDQRLL